MSQPRKSRGTPAGGEYRQFVHGDASGSLTSANEDRVLWPALGWEEQTWDTAASLGATRRERGASGRYRSAIPALIANEQLTLPGWLAADLDDATQQIAHFDADSTHRIGALTSVLIRSESASSSQIEQITASARAIAEAEVTGEGSGNAAVIAANVRAMTDALADDSPLTAGRIEGIQRSLLAVAPAMVGWRDEPVWIGSSSSSPIGADYVAPAYTRVPDAVDDLTRFVARNDLPVLAQAAIAHAQFETIHPFADGNGRTGRALVHLIMRDKGLTQSVTLPVSSGLLAERARYFDALTAYRSGDAAPIISVFCNASIRAVAHGEEFARRMTAITEDWRGKVAARGDSAVWKVLDVLPAHPVADAEMIAAATGGDSRNIHRALRQLVDTGILAEAQHYKSRRFLFRAPDVLKALDEYADGFGRRQR